MSTTQTPGDQTATQTVLPASPETIADDAPEDLRETPIANGAVLKSSDPTESVEVVTAPVSNSDAAPSTIRIDPALKSPDLFLNRELTWLQFNRRVLAEAEDIRNPLLERLKFLAITASNLDEFFMKRIGGLKQQVAAGVHELTVDGRTPHQQIAECYAEIRDFQSRQ
ncbi:MAG: hypothetical protein HY269_04020, partial [Deltaproteobacteria bacterium]|nr:hypothetical protein [Deltaproteobacteria bacterium]